MRPFQQPEVLPTPQTLSAIWTSAITPPTYELPAALQHSQCVQSPVRLAHSALWQLNEAYYRAKGLTAWEEIPYMITSSTVMADAYSDCILAYWQHLPPDMPLAIVELSTGPGRLSYLLLTLLHEKLPNYPQLQGRPWRYVMTDFLDDTVAFWQQHPNLKPFVESGILDFALFNPMVQTEITLIEQGIPLPQSAVIAIANYSFDSLPNDFIQVREGTLWASYMGLSLNVPHGENLPDTITREHIAPVFDYEPVTFPFYPFELWNTLLAKQAEQYVNASFYVPFGGLAALEVLKSHSAGHMMLLASDKGHVAKAGFMGVYDPEWTPHAGALSISVNMDIVADWFHLQHGHTYSTVQDMSLNLHTMVCVLDPVQSALDAYTHLDQAVYWHLHRQNDISGTWDWVTAACDLTLPTTDKAARGRVREWLNVLDMSQSDPIMMGDCALQLAYLTPYISLWDRKELVKHSVRALARYYPFPGEPILPYYLGLLFLHLDDYVTALYVCKLAFATSRHDAKLYTLLGCIYTKLHRYQAAERCFEQSLAITPGMGLPMQYLAETKTMLACPGAAYHHQFQQLIKTPSQAAMPHTPSG
jgi:hypothetical protein